MPLTINERSTFHQRIKYDPLYFHYEVLGGEKLWPRQEELLLAPLTHKRITVKAGHAVGKTYTIADIGLWWIASEPGSILITTAPSGRQVKTLLWGEMRNKYFKAKMPLGGQMDLVNWKIDEKWYAIGFSTDEPVNVGGFHGKRVMVIVDEASGMKDEIMDGLDSAVSGDECRLIYTGNPLVAKGRFYESFKDPSFKKMTISCLDHPNVVTGKELYPGMVSKDWVDTRRTRWGLKSPLWLSRVTGEFYEGASDVLIELLWMEGAKERKLDLNDSDAVELGGDVSDGGTDETSAFIRKGPVALHSESWHPGRDETMVTAGRFANLIRKFGVTIAKIDKIGVGAGVTTRLMELAKEGRLGKCKVIGVNVAESATDTEQFQIIRDEMWYGFADRFQSGQIDLRAVADNEELCSQLTSIKKGKNNSRGQLKVESKDDMKKDGRTSPDRGDAACLAYFKAKAPPILTSAHVV